MVLIEVRIKLFPDDNYSYHAHLLSNCFLQPPKRLLRCQIFFFGSGEYGVSPGDSTFELVTQHATFVNQWINSQPPQPGCDVECWVPFTGWYNRQCQNIPELCSVFWNVIEEAKNGTRSTREVQETRFLIKDRTISLAGLQVFPSRAMCCRPGLGAFTKGCSWTTWVWS